MTNRNATAIPASELINTLGLIRHPEGGWYREIYRSTELIAEKGLPERFNGPRALSTSIYFLLEYADMSALHRIKSDELWYFHSGVALTIHIFTAEGAHSEVRLGSNISAGESFQAMVPAGSWFGAEISGNAGYALVSCAVSPGFDFADFEMGDRHSLITRYPEYEHIIIRLTA